MQDLAPIPSQDLSLNLACLFEPGACFAKGTLVHTKEGLVPIEQIKVGDWVLSKPENGGEQAYKRVLQTFAHKPERIVNLNYILPGQERTYGKPLHLRRISVTLNHPFWTKEKGWSAVSELNSYESTFEDVDGQSIEFAYLRRVYVSNQPNVGWWPLHMGAWDSPGVLWNFDTHTLVDSSVMPLESLEETYRDLRDPESIDQSFFFTAPVYNLEVEDFHTYYVGEHGIWVHNQNCGGLNFEARNTKNPLPISSATPDFHSRVELKNWFKEKGVNSKEDLTQNSGSDTVLKVNTFFQDF